MLVLVIFIRAFDLEHMQGTVITDHATLEKVVDNDLGQVNSEGLKLVDSKKGSRDKRGELRVVPLIKG